MRLGRLRLREFRQHADTEIAFGPGITGIIGPNGSGKTTLLEAIAWAIYGHRAARGDKDSIRNFRAKARASVRVELDFGLGAHEYRVVRGLNTAELHQDGQLVANSLTAVTEKLERALGLDYDEFFKTYFTGQKELAVMAGLKGRTERAAFLSQVLGYDRLRVAQERVRERKSEWSAELRGLEAGLPDRAILEAERATAVARLDAARRAAESAQDARAAAEIEYGCEQPSWKAWVEKEKRVRSLGGDRRMAEQAVVVAKQECERLDREMAAALKAREQLAELHSELEPIERLRRELAGLEVLQKEEAARREDQGQLEELARTIAALGRRIEELAPAADALAALEREVAALGEQLAGAERAVEEERTAWVRDRQDAETKRLALREQYREVKEQRDLIVQLGPDGTCPTCKRPLGAEYAAVLVILDRQLEDITINGNFFKQRVEQLAEPPSRLREAEAARDAVLERQRRSSERAGQLRAQLEERQRAAGQRRADDARAQQIEAQLRARPTGYDAQRHDKVRAELTKLDPVMLEAAKLAERARRAEILVKEAELAEKALSVHERRAQELAAALRAEAFSEEAFAAGRQRHEETARALREAELAVAEARGELTAAETGVREVARRETERAGRERRVTEVRALHRLHDELDRAFSNLRTELNAAMRPELAELASGFLADLTDGRYDEIDLTEDYQVTVLEEGVPKPVISGGEEDLANFALRLAISQMIAERAGQPLSLLVLDEIFGSLDEARRQHVLTLLRRLADRFPQVILITHIEQVREGLDRVIRVDFDAARGTSAVRDDTATLGAADAGVAA